MITNTGKNIIAKYLINTAPAYASYIALGCGAKPRVNINSVSGASSVGSLVTVSNTQGLWVGAKVIKTAGTGTLSTAEDTVVTAVNSSTTFTISPAPSVALSGATLTIQADPRKETLDFEMFRVPITSRGYVNDNGINKVVLTAQLPTEERYEITEVGIFSAGANTSAGLTDSKVLFTFAQDESWEYHGPSAATAIPTFTQPLDPDNDNVIKDKPSVFQSNANNSVFDNTTRLERYERLRFLNNIIMMAGNDANLKNYADINGAGGTGTVVTYTTAVPHYLNPGDVVTITGVNPTAYNLSNVTIAAVPSTTSFTVNNSATGIYVSGGSVPIPHLVVGPNSNHIHLTGTVLDLNRNSPSDLMKLAFSVVNKDGTSTSSPDSVRVLVEFASSDIAGSGEFARFEVDIVNGTGVGQYDLSKNRYIVIEKELQSLLKSVGFTWNVVDVAKVYATAIVAGVPSDDYYIALDAIRLDNVSTVNPLYGMTGYSIIQNPDAETVIKSPNTNNYIEFRFILDVT
jgi:hypothetical protein